MKITGYTLFIFLILQTIIYADHIYDDMDSLIFNPVGSGARALGMGGAFIAVADDATAASWNPGGLIQLKTGEFSIVYDSSSWKEDNRSTFNSFQPFSSRISEENLNYFSITTPLEVFGRNFVFSVNYQHLFAFKRDFSFTSSKYSPNDKHYSLKQDGKLSAVGFAICYQVLPNLSVGFTLNVWNDWFGKNGWDQSRRERTPIILDVGIHSISDQSVHSEYEFKGINANIGALWDITDSFTCGLVFKTPFRADLKHTLVYVTHSPLFYQPAPTVYTKNLEMPMSCGIGFAYRFSDCGTISTDLYMTDWSKFILIDPNGDEYSFIDAKKIEESTARATYQYRFGAEYLIFNRYNKLIIPLRAGLFYDPMPTDGSPDPYYGFSMGTGFSSGSYIFDVAYQYRFASHVGEYRIKHLGLSQNVEENRLYGSFIFHF